MAQVDLDPIESHGSMEGMSTTKFIVSAILMQMAADMEKAQALAELRWTPRELNFEADRLSNSDYTGFNPSYRVPLVWSELMADWGLSGSRPSQSTALSERSGGTGKQHFPQ